MQLKKQTNTQSPVCTRLLPASLPEELGAARGGGVGWGWAPFLQPQCPEQFWWQEIPAAKWPCISAGLWGDGYCWEGHSWVCSAPTGLKTCLSSPHLVGSGQSGGPVPIEPQLPPEKGNGLRAGRVLSAGRRVRALLILRGGRPSGTW